MTIETYRLLINALDMLHDFVMEWGEYQGELTSDEILELKEIVKTALQNKEGL